MDKSQVTFDGYYTIQNCLWQQDGSSVIRTGIIDQTIIEPFKVKVKLNSTNYSDFMDKTFFAWHNFQSYSFKVKRVFMHNNVPSHVSKLTYEFFEHERFTGDKIMEWPPSPDLNLIENLQSIVKVKLYEGGKQYNSKADLWKAIKTTKLEIEPAEVKTLSKSMDNRLMAFIEKVTILECKDLCFFLYYRC